MPIKLEGNIEGDTQTQEVEQVELDDQPAAAEDDAPAADAGATDSEGGTTDAEPGATADADDGELTITLGEEDPDDDDETGVEETAVPVLRKVRNELKERTRGLRARDREIAELKARLEQVSSPGAAAAQQLGPEPSMDDADVDYDGEKFKAKYKAWAALKQQRDAEDAKRAAATEAQNRRWQERFDTVNTAGKSLKVPDHDDAVAAFETTFSPLQRGIILGGPDDAKLSAQLRYALGRAPKVAKELAAIEDPVKFTFAVADLMNKKLKVAPRRTAPTPERVVRSSVAGANANDNTLEKLREEARKTGDLSKVVAYKAEQRKKVA
jgi:hypothetical protein